MKTNNIFSHPFLPKQKKGCKNCISTFKRRFLRNTQSNRFVPACRRAGFGSFASA
jgi:hypothetical protein